MNEALEKTSDSNTTQFGSQNLKLVVDHGNEYFLLSAQTSWLFLVLERIYTSIVEFQVIIVGIKDHRVQTANETCIDYLS